jgi:cell division protein FtsI/penicillin-binding protein 2
MSAGQRVPGLRDLPLPSSRAPGASLEAPPVSDEGLKRRAWAVLALLFGLYLLVFGKVAYLQLWARPKLEDDGKKLQPRFREPAGRPGEILDAYERVLATSVQTFAIKIKPEGFRQEKSTPAQRAAAVRILAQVLGVSEAEIWEKVNSPAPWEYLARRVSPEVKARLAEAVDKYDLPYIRWDAEYQRAYPFQSMACHLLGWRGRDHAARCGLEAVYDFLLTGLPGSAAGMRDKYGRLIPWPAARRPLGARPGRSLVLTIDLDVQQVVEAALDHLVVRYHPLGGCQAVVMDPRTGAVLGMAARPAYDPNWFSGVASGRRPTNADLSCPLVHHAWEPGSVMKVFAVAEALEQGLTSEGEVFLCPGAIMVGGKPLHCAHGTAHGRLDLSGVVAKSCNISAARLAMRVGPQRMLAMLHRFGFGAPTYVGLQHEGFGSLPPAPGHERLYERDVANLGFGQGLSVTMMQLAAAYAALVNDGVYMQPYVVDRVVEANGIVYRRVEPVAVRRVCSAATSRRLRAMLKLCVEAGTGQAARIAGLEVGGKTGTADKAKQGGYQGHIAVFVLVAPVWQPEILVAVMADEPQGAYYGGAVAAPVAREIALGVLRLRGQLPAAELHAHGT